MDDQMNNHEGYHDPTAGRAIRNAARMDQKGRVEKSRRLTYRLEEIRVFRESVDLKKK